MMEILAEHSLAKTALGKETQYTFAYDPKLLFPVPRQQGRSSLQMVEPLPFFGVDIWNAYELSWLNPQGKPEIALAEFRVPVNSANLIESKSFKLYLNSYYQTPFANQTEVKTRLQEDLSKATESDVGVRIIMPEFFANQKMDDLPGFCLDHLNIAIQSYQLDPTLLTPETGPIHETLHSHLFRSRCPVTGQPDWASILIRYEGNKINHEGLLKYLVAFREQDEFGEHCAERVFMDIMRQCKPDKLTVYMRFTRRGGLDINPFRSNFEARVENIRSFRQ